MQQKILHTLRIIEQIKNKLNLHIFSRQLFSKWQGFLITFNLVSFIIPGISYSQIPLLPSNPYSDESFETIKNYYQLNNTLPLPQSVDMSERVFDKYKIQRIKLFYENYPEVIFEIKLPLIISKPLPAVVLFSGFQTGAQAIQFVGNSDSVAYVGFEYPWPIKIDDQSIQWDWRRIEAIPILMTFALAWLHRSPIIDHQKINIVNVSFGNLFFPLAQRILNQYNLYSRSVVFGYGGVDFSEIIGGHLQKKINSFELDVAKLIIKNQTWIFEPKYHLSHLKGPFLVVKGADDDVFPATSHQELIANLSSQAKMITLPGSHIQPDREDLISNFMNEVNLFLKENKAL